MYSFFFYIIYNSRYHERNEKKKGRNTFVKKEEKKALKNNFLYKNKNKTYAKLFKLPPPTIGIIIFIRISF